MTSSGLKILINPAICFPSFCPISSTISIQSRSSLLTAVMISSSVMGVFFTGYSGGKNRAFSAFNTLPKECDEGQSRMLLFPDTLFCRNGR